MEANNNSTNQMTKTNKVTIAVNVDLDLFEKIKEQAAKSDRAIANYVRSILKMVHPDEVDAE